MTVSEPAHLSETAAVYDATARRYAQTVGTTVSAQFEAPLDRAFLTAFAELVAPAGGLVADVGCGPGRVAAYLADRGVEVVGLDLSSEMVATARAAHPHLRFEEGRLTELPFTEGALIGAVSWYSIIHTPPEELAAVMGELRRVVAPGGHVAVAFQAGHGEAVERADAHGSGVTLTSFRHDGDEVSRCLEAADLPVRARLERQPVLEHESTAQAFLLARRRA